MSFVVADRVQETCVSPGTGTVNLLGAVTGYKSFSSSIGANNTCYYVIADQYGTNWEVGIGTIGSGGITLARTTVLASSNGGSLVAFTSGTQNVWVDYPATKVVTQDLIYAPSSFQGTFTDGIVMDYVTGNGRFSVGTADGFTWYNGGVGSTNLMTLLSNGNLGIGTASPGTKLQVLSGTSTGASWGSNQYIRVDGSSGASYSAGVATTGNTVSGYYVSTSANAYEAGMDYDGTSKFLTFRTNNAERMRLDASGNLGLGVTPSAWSLGKAIQVGSTSSLLNDGSGYSYLLNNAYYNSGWKYLTSNPATNYTMSSTGQHQWFISASGTAGNAITFTQAMTLDNSGNLLVGITSASGFVAKTIVNRQGVTGAPIFTWTNNANNSGHTYVFANGSGISSDGYLAFGSNEAGAGAFTERMRIDTSGNLNIGSTANIGASENTNAGVTNYGQGIVAIARSSTSAALDVSKIGTLGSGTMQQFSYNGGVIGSITNTSSAVAYVTSSDYRLKENIAPMTGALDTVAKLKPVTYTWKADGSDGQGFIAHELAEVVPDCVSGEKDAVNEDGSIKPQGIDTSFLVATLTAAIQELKAIVDTQAEQIKALQGAK